MLFLRKHSAILLLCLLGFSPCAAQGADSSMKEPSVPTLRIGLPPERNIFRQVERYEPLMRYVGKKAGVKFELKVFPGYSKIVSDFEDMRLDGAFFGSFTYVIAHAQMGHMVIARPESLAGVSSYQGILVVRGNSPIRSAKDMKGKRMAIADVATTAGCLLSKVYFLENGIQEPKNFLKELYIAGTHEATFRDVIEGRAEIGAAKNTVFEKMVAEDPLENAGMIRVLAVTPEAPENGLAFRPEVDGNLVLKIKGVLLAMDRDPEGAAILKDFGARRFIETADGEYNKIREYAKKAGSDPEPMGCRK